jgi:cytosine/adenosine deaminase-related metal-dependent hydrolase
MRTLIYNARLVATMDDDFTTFADGYVLVEDERVLMVGEGTVPSSVKIGRKIDARGKLVLPGLVNAHHHLFETLTRVPPRVQQAQSPRWLSDMYEAWRSLDRDMLRVAAKLGLGELLLAGCATTADHLYVFPTGQERLLDVAIEAARELGIRFHAARGCLGRDASHGGRPPDELVEDPQAVLADCRRLLRKHHDPKPGAMTRIALAPCSPFAVSDELMRRSADLAREHGARLHTHLCETKDEVEHCEKKHGCRPVEHLRRRAWLGQDVWLAHGVHVDLEELRLLGETRTAVAHCPGSNLRLGTGVAPVRRMLDAGVPVGLGADGAAGGDVLAEAQRALLASRLHPNPKRWLHARDALWMATRGGARCLGRDDIGSLQTGRCADIALLDTRGLSCGGAAGDILSALLLAPRPWPLEMLMVNGRIVVEEGRVAGLDVPALVRQADEIALTLLAGASRRTGTDYFARS